MKSHISHGDIYSLFYFIIIVILLLLKNLMSELGIMFMNHDMSIGVQVFFSPAQTPQPILFYLFIYFYFYFYFFMNKDRYTDKN